MTAYDGFLLTRGHYSNNSSATHDYQTGAVAWCVAMVSSLDDSHSSEQVHSQNQMWDGSQLVPVQKVTCSMSSYKMFVRKGLCCLSW